MSQPQSPVERLTALARRHGFDGASGQELLAFLEKRLVEGQKAQVEMAECLRNIEGLSPAPLIGESAPAWVKHVVSESRRRMDAQQATIEILMSERRHCASDKSL